MEITARHKHVILSDYQRKEKKTAAGIVLPDQTDKRDAYGVIASVLAVGPECTDLKEGDRVMFNVHDATPFADGADTLHSIREELIMAVLN